MNKLISIYKYHIRLANEQEVEEGVMNIVFAAFTNSIENEMLGVKWINPIGEDEGILISDIHHIEFLGIDEMELDTEMNRYAEV